MNIYMTGHMMHEETVKACITYITEIQAMPGYENFVAPTANDFLIDSVHSVKSPETLTH
jgi:hypothetical protein